MNARRGQAMSDIIHRLTAFGNFQCTRSKRAILLGRGTTEWNLVTCNKCLATRPPVKKGGATP